MFPYKVEYIYSTREKGKWYQTKNAVDAWTLAKELEALLIEYHDQGYEVISIVPIQTHELVSASYPGSKTDGLVVTFKQRMS